MRFPPVSFHQHSPLHAIKVVDMSAKLNRIQRKQSDFVQ